MRTHILNYIVDALALLVMLAMVVTGLWLKYVLPPGSRGGQGLSLWGLTRHDWGDVHFWLAVALAALVLLHVALHWGWVCTWTAVCARAGRRAPAGLGRGRKLLYGAVTLVVLAAGVGGAVWYGHRGLARDAAESPSDRGGRGFRGGRGAYATPADRGAVTALALTPETVRPTLPA